MRFFGISLLDFNNLPQTEFQLLVESMHRLEAQEILQLMKVQDFSNMKSDARRRIHRSLMKKAYPDTMDSPKAITTEQLKVVLQSRNR